MIDRSPFPACGGIPRKACAYRPLWCFLILVLVQSSASAINFPLRWRWSNPLPHGGNIVDMAYSQSLSLAVQVAEFGQLYSSSDFSLWLPRETGVTNWLRSVVFFGDRLLVTGEEGMVLYADDLDNFQRGVLLDGPTTSWFEAVTASPTLAVAAGDAGAIYTSPDGVRWKKQNSGTSNWLLGVAFGDGVFVVVGESGTIRTSSDGTNWVRSSSGTSENLNRIKFLGSRFTAVGDAGIALSSTNKGANWFAEKSGATNTLDNVAVGAADRLIVGDQEVRLHQGVGWSNELARAKGPPRWSYYSALGNPGYFLIGGQSGLMAEAYQPPGWVEYEWSVPLDSVRHWLWGVMRLPTLYVAVGDFGSIMTSGNGVEWTLEYVPPANATNTLLGVGGNTNLLLAVGDNGTVLYSPNILSEIVITNGTGIVVTQWVSSLGVLWYRAQALSTTSDLQAVGVLNNSVYFVGGARGALFSSTDGVAWTPQNSGTTNLLSSITDWPGGLVACGKNGTLLTSTDGSKWTKVPTGTVNWIYRVRWVGGQLVALGEKGLIRTSIDGVTWVTRNSGTTAWLTDVAHVEDTWFATGISGTILVSTNLANWTDQGTITAKGLYGAATDGSQLVVVGVDGAILRAQVKPDTTPVSFLNFSHLPPEGAGDAYNIFLFGGKPDQFFLLERAGSATSPHWGDGIPLDITDGSGTLYYVETLTGTNAPASEIYRTRLR